MGMLDLSTFSLVEVYLRLPPSPLKEVLVATADVLEVPFLYGFEFRTSVDLSTLPNPTKKDGKHVVVLQEAFYLEGREIWQFSLGRLDFKGINFNDTKKTLEQQWQLGDGRVQFVSLNRGFFIVKLKSQDDKNKIFEAESWMVDQQKLSLMEWYPSFDADRRRTSHATVWVKFPGLPMEFLIGKTLLGMAKSVGTPIVVDKRTLAHEYGYFASVLIDINFAEHDMDSIHVSVGGLDFWKSIDIPKKPKFCSKCNIVGHADSEYKHKHKNNNNSGQL
ncbi:uncharacterized protein LOC113360442 [Papaver somniferum]|uniref:uncharacterized protein LOC113360442 n=1 Tax=Papaver somniferum TaxID=3469 RepID=UPI000E6FCFF0|nr:uncharacterized protein LOC113360442 [Papaver somniferum]